jgi:hypothetical protein
MPSRPREAGGLIDRRKFLLQMAIAHNRGPAWPHFENLLRSGQTSSKSSYHLWIAFDKAQAAAGFFWCTVSPAQQANELNNKTAEECQRTSPGIFKLAITKMGISARKVDAIESRPVA